MATPWDRSKSLSQIRCIRTIVNTSSFPTDRLFSVRPRRLERRASDNSGGWPVVFHRLIMPDGYSVDLNQFHGLDQIGEEG